jgi:hypothetical protein
MDRRVSLILFSAIAIFLATNALAPKAFCLPQRQYGEFRVAVDDRGVVYLSYLALNITGNVVIWGPGWSWDTVCSWQPNWPLGASEDNALYGELTCNFGNLTWRERYWLLEDALALEYELGAASNVSIADIAWQWGLPIASFMGSYVTYVTSVGSLRNVTLRPEYVPGQAGLASDTGIGWIVPLGPSTGVVVIGISDSRSFVGLTSTDEREWNGTTYTTRLYFNPDRLVWKPGNRIRGTVYIFPYSSREDLEEVLKRANSVIYLIRANVAYDDIVKLLVEGRVVEEVERMESQRRSMLITYVAAVVALILALAVILIIRHRRK